MRLQLNATQLDGYHDPLLMRTPVEVLMLFNEKAEVLDRSGFTRHVRENSLGWSGQVADGQMNLLLNGPTEDEVAAFVLTMRFFVQDNEPTSIRKMAELYESLPISSLLKDQMRAGRATINEILQRDSPVTIIDERISNQLLFDTFVWGGLAHANQAHKKRFDAWRANGVWFVPLQSLFHNVLVDLLEFIFWVHEHNQIAIRELTAGEPE